MKPLKQLTCTRDSGSKINMDKCEVYPLNRSNPYLGKYKDITTDKIKLLGITFSKKGMQKLNWEPVLRKAQAVDADGDTGIDSHRHRPLSTIPLTLITHCFLESRIYHHTIFAISVILLSI